MEVRYGDLLRGLRPYALRRGQEPLRSPRSEVRPWHLHLQQEPRLVHLRMRTPPCQNRDHPMQAPPIIGPMGIRVSIGHGGGRFPQSVPQVCTYVQHACSQTCRQIGLADACGPTMGMVLLSVLVVTFKALWTGWH